MVKSFTRRAVAAAAVAGLVATGSLSGVGHQTAKAAGPVTLHFWMGPDTNTPNDYEATRQRVQQSQRG